MGATTAVDASRGQMLTRRPDVARPPSQLKKCESLPTKKQLYATIAGLVKQPTTKLATGIKMISTKLAIAVKKVREG